MMLVAMQAVTLFLDHIATAICDSVKFKENLHSVYV